MFKNDVGVLFVGVLKPIFNENIPDRLEKWETRMKPEHILVWDVYYEDPQIDFLQFLINVS